MANSNRREDRRQAEFRAILQSSFENRQSPVDRAVQRYEITLKHGTGPRRADRNVAEQADNYRASQMRTDLRVSQIRAVLNELDVPLILFAAYRNFGLHVDKLIRQYGDETLRQLVTTAISRWVCLGLNASVLQAVCEKVFGLKL
jgi:hypothetical protein